MLSLSLSLFAVSRAWRGVGNPWQVACVRVGGARRAREPRVWAPAAALCAFFARHVWYLNAVKPV